MPQTARSLLILCSFLVVWRTATAVVSRFCGLSFNSKQSMGYEMGTQMQVCCGVGELGIWAFRNAQTFEISEKVLQQSFSGNESETWSELQLSQCTDRSEATIGFVDPLPGVNCTYLSGQTVNLQQKVLDMPQWYVVCYQKRDCSSCRVDVLCANDLSIACADISVIGSATTSTNSSLKYWYTIGLKYPFAASSTVRVSVIRQRTMEVVQNETRAVKVGAKEHLVFGELQPAEWYVIRRCLQIELPAKLLSSSSEFAFESPTNSLCVEEAYRTANGSLSCSQRTMLLAFLAALICRALIWLQ